MASKVGSSVLVALAAVGAVRAAETIDDIRVDALVQSHWDQLYAGGNTLFGTKCYNYYTPVMTNEYDQEFNMHCGCVATALAQVMRYHEWPRTYVRPETYVCQVYSPVSTNLNQLERVPLTMVGGTYDWSKMPLATSRTGNDPEEMEMIGRLCYDSGVAISARYMNGMTAAGAYSAMYSFRENFGYATSESIFWTLSSNMQEYSPVEFQKMVVPSLDAKLPCVLTIYGERGGHTVVCDGYGFNRGEFFIHINAGYSGNGDGWYAPTNITGIIGNDYTSINGVNFNISPTNTGSIISGRVVNREGRGVPGARVSVSKGGVVWQTVTTDAKGIYACWEMPDWNVPYEVQAERDGVVSETRSVTLYPNYSVTNADRDGSYTYPLASVYVGNSPWNDLTLDVDLPVQVLDVPAGQTVTLRGPGDYAGVRGAGTLVCDGFWPATLAGFTNDTWTGTLCIANMAGCTGTDGCSFAGLGNVSSVVEMDGVSGWFGGSETCNAAPWTGAVCDYTLRVGAGGLTIANGFSNKGWTFAKLAGSGTLAINRAGGNPSVRLAVRDASEFTGSLSVGGDANGGIIVGTPQRAVDNGKIRVESGTAVSVAAGKTWSARAGLVLEGTVSVTPGSPFAGAVSVADGATLNVRADGSADRYELTSGTLTLAARAQLQFSGTAASADWVVREGGIERSDAPRTEIPHANDATAVATPQVVDYAVRAANPVSFGNATKRFVFADGCDIEAPRFVLGNERNTSQHVVQTGGCVTVTGAGEARSATDCPVLLGHWPGTDRSYTLSGGTFRATNGVLRLGWDGGCALTVGGGTPSALLQVRGLRAGAERSQDGSSLSVLTNGTLSVGARGLSVAASNVPVTLAGGTLTAYESATVEAAGGLNVAADSVVDVPAGVVLTLSGSVTGTGRIEKRGAGRLVVNDAASVERFVRTDGLLTGPLWTPPAEPVTIDVMFAFEADAKGYVENDLGQTLEAFARGQIAKMNAVLPNTALDRCMTFRYVGHTNLNVVCHDIGTALYRATYPEDYPAYQPIHALREASGADVGLVMVYPEDSTSGTAGGSYGLQDYEDVADHAEKAYSVVSVVAAVQQDTSVHEIAHLMGAGHPNRPDAGGQHWKAYAYGLYFADGDGYRWHTVMGYGSDGGLSYTAIPYFSSPEFTYRGVPVGTLANDNTRTLRETCVGVSRWRAAKYVERSAAQRAAQDSPSRPALLFSAGAQGPARSGDGWQVVDVNGTQAYAAEYGGVRLAGSTTAKFWRNTNAVSFASGTFTDLYGRAWSDVREEMLVSLGLRETSEADLASFLSSGANVGSGAGSAIALSGLVPGRTYVLYYGTGDGQNGKPSSFRLRAGAFAGAPKVAYVRGAAAAYAAGSAESAVTAAAGELLLVRVSGLMPTAEGTVVLEVGGATVNALMLSETPAEAPNPVLFWLW